MNDKVIKGFALGVSQVQIRQKKEIEEKIMKILNVTTKASYHNYRSGRQYLRADQAAKIEALFKSYGIKECWGEA